VEVLQDTVFYYDRNDIQMDYSLLDNTKNLISLGHLFGQSIHDVLPTQMAERFHHARSQALEAQEIQIFQYQLEVNGEFYYCKARITPHNSLETIATVRDTTEHQKNMSELESLRAQILAQDHKIRSLTCELQHTQNQLKKSETLVFK